MIARITSIAATAALLLVVFVATAADAQHEQKVWNTVGGDPCRVAGGCTLEWALKEAHDKLDWPLAVTETFLRKAREGEPKSVEFQICGGDAGFWMTFGEHKAKFWPNTKAGWDPGKCEPAFGWQHIHEEIRYSVYQVRACRNWGGETEAAPEPEPEEPEFETPMIPVINCP